MVVDLLVAEAPAISVASCTWSSNPAHDSNGDRDARLQADFSAEPLPPLSSHPGEEDVTPSVRGDDVGAVLVSYAESGFSPLGRGLEREGA